MAEWNEENIVIGEATDEISFAELTPGEVISRTAWYFGFERLPGNIVFVDTNNPESDETIASAMISNDIIVQRISHDKIGSVTPVTFASLMVFFPLLLVLVIACIRRERHPRRFGWAASDSNDKIFIPRTEKQLFLEELRKIYPLPPKSPPTPSFAEAILRTAEESTSLVEVHRCRKLLRELYALKVYIINMEYVHEVNRPMVDAKQMQLDVGREELHRIVKEWTDPTNKWTDQELELLNQVREKINGL